MHNEPNEQRTAPRRTHLLSLLRERLRRRRSLDRERDLRLSFSLSLSLSFSLLRSLSFLPFFSRWRSRLLLRLRLRRLSLFFFSAFPSFSSFSSLQTERTRGGQREESWSSKNQGFTQEFQFVRSLKRRCRLVRCICAYVGVRMTECELTSEWCDNIRHGVSYLNARRRQ